MDPKELLKKLESLRAAMDVSIKALDAEKDAAKKAEIQKSYDATFAEATTIKTALDTAIRQANERKALDETLVQGKAMSAIDTKGKSLFGAVAAEPADHVKRMHAHAEIVHKFLKAPKGRVELSGQEMELVRPKSSAFKAGASGVCLPLSMTLKMLGTRWATQMGISPTEIAAAQKASVMVSSSDALGGYTVPEDFRATLIDLPVEEPHILPRATVLPSDTGEITIPRSKQEDGDEFGGMTGSWISEAGGKPQTDTQFEQVKIDANEYAMYTQISIRLLERSAIAMENWITTRARQVCLNAMDQAFINGSGSGQPLGILSTAGIRSVNRQVDNQIAYKDLVNLKYALKPYHRAGAVFVCQDTGLAYLEGILDGEDRPLFTASVANGIYDRLVGYPYIPTTRTPALGTAGDFFFGDLREYYVAMEQDVVVKRSDDYDIIHNVATIVVFMVVGGELVEPRVVAELNTTTGS